jgi:tRNA(Phe) wybutosine-synthesizing methylase Tyw3
LDEERRKSFVDEEKIREVQKILNDKIKHANEQAKKLNDYARKSEKDDEEIRFLR